MLQALENLHACTANHAMANIDRYTLSYRSNEARQVMEWVRAGQCGSIIGLRGAGKSNFLQFLLREDVKQQYLGQSSKDFHFIPINLLSLAERTDWGVYEILLGNAVSQLHPPDWENTALDQIPGLHQEVLRSRDALIAQRAFEHCMTLMSQQSTRRLVFIFDEFDDVFRELPAALFRCLRAIRDAHKEQISFVVVATQELAELRDQQIDELDHFHRLVGRNICWLGPYGEADAREMVRYLAARRNRILSEDDTTRLIEMSGGHAGLLKTVLSFIWNNESTSALLKDVAELMNESSVHRECGKIWESLAAGEQAALCALARGEPLPSQMLAHLTLRGLLRRSSAVQAFFSPLFAAFVKEQTPPAGRGTYIDRTGRIVQIDGQRIQDLTELEFEILLYLYEGRGRLCTKDDIVRNVYRQRYDNFQGGVTDEALQALISRLREKIEPDRSHPRYVVTVRGEGYKFVVPGDDR